MAKNNFSLAQLDSRIQRVDSIFGCSDEAYVRRCLVNDVFLSKIVLFTRNFECHDDSRVLSGGEKQRCE